MTYSDGDIQQQSITFTSVAVVLVALLEKLGQLTPQQQMELLVQLAAALGAVVAIWKMVVKPGWRHLGNARHHVVKLMEVPAAVDRIEERQILSDARNRARWNTGEPMFETDHRGATTWWSDSYKKLVGALNDEGRGMGWLNFIALEDREDVYKEWQATVEQQRDYHATVSLLTVDGKQAHNVTAYAIFGKSGELAGYVGRLVKA